MHIGESHENLKFFKSKLITPSPRGSAFSNVRWESKILGKRDGPAYKNSRLRIKVNQGNYNRFKSPDILTVTEISGLE